MTRARSTRASWSAAAVVSPIVAAMAAGSLLWAASNNPLATAGEAAPVPTATSVVQPVSDPVEAATSAEQPSLAQLRKRADRLAKAVKKARKEARAARAAGVVAASAGGSTWAPSPGSSGSGSSGSGGASAAQPAPAPEPPPADTWTGSSGG